jgi:ABC-type molybdate transport system substrate-binding protein
VRNDILTFFIACLALTFFNSEAQNITIAAAADLRLAMDEVIDAYEQSNPGR